MIVALLLACADGEPTAPGLEPTLSNVQAEVFTPSCAFSTCHAAPGASGLVLEEGAAHAELVGVDSEDNPGHPLVLAGDAEGSYLVAKLRGDADILGDPMPYAGDRLDEELIQLVVDWIDAGAADH